MELKMRKITIFTAIILVLLLAVSCGKPSLTPSDTDTGTVSADGEFVFSERYDGTLSLFKYNGDDTDVTVPSENEGKKVTAVSSFAFEGKSEILSVTLPDGITTVESCAFATCTALEEINLPESAVFISKESFEDTAWYSAMPDGFVTVNGTLLEYKGIGEDVSSVQIPDGTVRIGDRAFYGLSIKSVTIPESVTSVGERAFNKCTSLMRITLPAGINDVGYAAFHDTAWFNLQTGAVVVGDVLVGCKANSSALSIPSKVRAIAGGAFLGYNAVAISVPEGVVEICDYAFSGCTQIIKINLPSTVTEIGEHAFDLCPTLMGIDVSNNNDKYMSENGILYGKEDGAELFVPEGKPAPESEKYDPRDENSSLN